MKFPFHSFPFFLAAFALCSCQPNESATDDGQGTGAPEQRHFDLLPPAHTGIVFTNTIQEQRQANYFTANYLYIGGGVGAGDFNKDGLMDLYFVAVTGENKLYFNRGDLKFEDVTARAGVGLDEGAKTGVSIVDINADGWPDIYQCRTGETPENRSNRLFINQMDGTFTEQAKQYGLDLDAPSTEANFFDYDLDGDLDVYIINRPVDFSTNSKTFLENSTGKPRRMNAPQYPYETDRLFKNNGNGTFTDVSTAAGINNRAFSLSVNIIDANSDGYPDVYVANDYIEPDNLYINQRNGTFTDQWNTYFRHMSHFSMGSDVADFNNDGLMDIVTLDMLPSDNFRNKQNGTIMKLDRYTSLVNFGYGHQIMRNMLHLNNGNAGFNEVACLAGIQGTDWSWTPLLADFDNDGWKDLYITNGMKRDVTDQDFTNYTMDSLQAAGTNMEDFSKVSQLIPSHKLRNFMFKNTGGLRTKDVTEAWGLPEKSFSNGALYTDLDNDGDLDLVVHNTDDVAFIYKNTTRENGGGNFIKINLTGPVQNPSGVGTIVKLTSGGMEQTLAKQLNRGFLSSADQGLHVGLGKQTGADKVIIIWPDRKTQVLNNVPANQTLVVDHKNATGTVAEDVKPAPLFEYVQDNLGLDYVHVENAFEDFDRERLLHRRYSNQGPCLARGDINGDGLDDLFIGGSFIKKGAVYVQSAAGTFSLMPQPAFERELIHEDVDAVFFDANGDGAQDLFIASGGNEAPFTAGYYVNRLYLNNGTGTLLPSVSALPVVDESSASVAAYDFDGDGDLDLAVGGNVKPGEFPRVSRSFLLQNNQGTFKDVTGQLLPAFSEAGIVRDIVFEDLDGDGKAEMITAGEWMPISVYEVSASGFKNVSSRYGLENTEGWWASLFVADFDGDGRKDIAAGNLGLNCRLKASLEAPVEVFAADLDQNGQLDPIYTYYNNGQRFPLAHRNSLISQVPVFKKQFVRFKPYSEATLDKVLPVQSQQAAIHRMANCFANSIFWGTKEGRFERQDLPDLAQVSTILDMQALDINNDGLPDIVAVGNDYGLEIESGRMDAGDGWIIIGNKGRQLKVLPNRETGFWASREARQVEVVKQGSGYLLVVANNNDGMGVFRGK
ncbi:MAG: VCBS repeat-containing protein [Lewinellaceae bacterium]|nr:VCBS repeat-containing protein [Saprospiraceae bacterium]MCB9336696.1 VCBS repeat-containing protein [Lewinellaceae bacterium]